MKKFLTVLVVALVFAPIAFADKPDWAGKGKPTAEQKEAHRAAMKGKGDSADDLDEQGKKAKQQKGKKEKQGKAKEGELKGMEKQEVKKSEQVQKELEQGSEQGMEQRQERKKWWKFWGE